jgi:hypothetical protein
MTEIIGRIAWMEARPERWALLHADGSVSHWFARDAARDSIAETLAEAGLELRADDRRDIAICSP